VALQQFQAGQGERAHVGNPVGTAGFERDDLFGRARNREAGVPRAVAVAVAGGTRGAGFGQASACGKALARRAREQQRVRLGRRAHPLDRLGGNVQQTLTRALRLNQRPRKTLGFETPADKLRAVLR